MAAAAWLSKSTRVLSSMLSVVWLVLLLDVVGVRHSLVLMSRIMYSPATCLGTTLMKDINTGDYEKVWSTMKATPLIILNNLDS